MLFIDTGQLTANGIEVRDCQIVEEDKCVKIYDLDGVLEVTLSDVQFSISHPSDKRVPEDVDDDVVEDQVDMAKEDDDDGEIVFRHFELPMITSKIEDILRNEIEGNVFADMWKAVLDDADTLPLNVGEFSTIIMCS